MPTIRFKPVTEHYAQAYESPLPAGREIPEWYKKQSPHADGIRSMQDDGFLKLTVKRCAPVYDSLTAGYVFKTPVDIWFEKNERDNKHRIVWGHNEGFNVMIHDPSQVSNFPIDKEKYEAYPLKISTGWITILPEGYSMLVAHPMWRGINLPFLTLPGIIDSDSYKGTTNFFMLIEKGFNGIIPKGTPMGQVIPFQRETWDYEVENYEQGFLEIESLIDRQTFENSYKKRHHKEKIWELWKKTIGR
jgi:hypothetical protein